MRKGERRERGGGQLCGNESYRSKVEGGGGTRSTAGKLTSAGEGRTRGRGGERTRVMGEKYALSAMGRKRVPRFFGVRFLLWHTRANNWLTAATCAAAAAVATPTPTPTFLASVVVDVDVVVDF